eukprot:CAMPEP_0194033254 /NCGR_PEP_ID=MMETSP0009_2-20130614/6013_1 /TAXON_ID=210454 /ORGANISM="Grammatophora oceanica, Strain CCMP 410" /LENGTH=176 /DNA_ID=CAMNT_0038673917 /DNA_START=185 /DNA_END=717 /DNA_ORIENTATION=-
MAFEFDDFMEFYFISAVNSDQSFSRDEGCLRSEDRQSKYHSLFVMAMLMAEERSSDGTQRWGLEMQQKEEPPSHHGEETTSRNDHQGSFFGAFSPNVAPPTSSRDQCNKTTSNLFIPPTVPKEFVNRYVVDDRQGYSEAGSLTGEARQELTWLLQVIPSLMRVTILVERELRCLRK